MSVVMYAIGDSVVAGLVPATSRRCCGRVSICEICVSADVWDKCHTKGWWPAPGRPLHCYQGCSLSVYCSASAFFHSDMSV